MPNPRLTQILAELPFEKKLVGLGSALMIISLFFPWYQDIDSFRTGDTFTGLTGPMYFAGFTFLVLASTSLLVMVMEYLDKKLPIFKVKASQFHAWSGVVSFYMLFLVGTVYFHPAFGVNITFKQSGFGMFIAYAATALLTIGGYLEGRGKAALKTFAKETREQIEEVEEEKIPAPKLTARDTQTVQHKVVHPMIEQRKPRENLRQAQPTQPVQTVQQQAQMNQPETETKNTVEQSTPSVVHSAPAVQPERKFQPFRTDL